jgi:hypothetical protein
MTGGYSMSFIDAMQAYFRGEQIEAIAFIIPVGILLTAFGLIALKVERGGFAWGTAVPCVLFGLVLIAVGAGVALRTPGQVAEIVKVFEQAPAVMIEKELPRMQKVNANFKVAFIAFGVAVAVGLALIFLIRTNWALGLGPALIPVGAIGFFIDGFAERRAIPYTSLLVELAEQHQVLKENSH